ncbi:MAG: PKD domain-containing protein, partial [Thermoplasmata archaeon]|nr:PKD domain-containing protein [Thermoplasmata archaeon]
KGVSVYLYGRNPTYRFERNGEYLVRLTVRDASGNEGIDEITVLVREDASGDFPLLSLLWLLPILLVVVFLLAYHRLKKGSEKQGNDKS